MTNIVWGCENLLLSKVQEISKMFKGYTKFVWVYRKKEWVTPEIVNIKKSEKLLRHTRGNGKNSGKLRFHVSDSVHSTHALTLSCTVMWNHTKHAMRNFKFST